MKHKLRKWIDRLDKESTIDKDTFLLMDNDLNGMLNSKGFKSNQFTEHPSNFNFMEVFRVLVVLYNDLVENNKITDEERKLYVNSLNPTHDLIKELTEIYETIEFDNNIYHSLSLEATYEVKELHDNLLIPINYKDENIVLVTRDKTDFFKKLIGNDSEYDLEKLKYISDNIDEQTNLLCVNKNETNISVYNSVSVMLRTIYSGRYVKLLNGLYDRVIKEIMKDKPLTEDLRALLSLHENKSYLIELHNLVKQINI